MRDELPSEGMRQLEYSTEEEIRDTQSGRPHVVILGAGASRAAFPHGDGNGRPLPLMNDLVQTLGLHDQLAQAGHDSTRDFEQLYSALSDSPEHAELLKTINQRVEEYFRDLQLPSLPTIYDALVLSLRPKDLIATFNWDPFLYQACMRNHAVALLPRVVYLHGNVSIGYCLEHRKKGLRVDSCSVCNAAYTPSRLLYPVAKKSYNDDPFLSIEWKTLQAFLNRAFMLTIFGYSAPQSDVEAIDLMANAWGDVEDRNLEQTEVIDIKDEEQLRESWSRFIHTHHYDIRRSFYDSWLAKHPRRSCEAAWQQFFEARFISESAIPQLGTLGELWDWLRPRLDAERFSTP
jgi:hypothetical protein